MIRYLTSGESHGQELTAIIDGMPSGIKIVLKNINNDLRRRQGGYGRGHRQAIEKDTVQIKSGVRHGKTLGSPIALVVKNKDWENWLDIMSIEPISKKSINLKEVTKPRPGHADLTGALKYDHRDMRNILERSSARETAVRVAVGSLTKEFLKEFDINVYSWVTNIGLDVSNSSKVINEINLKDIESLHKLAEKSETRCPFPKLEKEMIKAIDKAKNKGDSLGGAFEVAVTGLAPGLGSFTQWDKKLDARLSFALMSIQAIKGVEIGLGMDVASTPGSKVHDEIFYKKSKNKSKDTWPSNTRFYRKTNRSGGIEGGMSNGEPIIVRASMKPIPTLYKPLQSVDVDSKKKFKASIERSDICAVPAASVVAENVVAFEIASAFLEKFGGDSIKEIKRNYKSYLKQIESF